MYIVVIVVAVFSSPAKRAASGWERWLKAVSSVEPRSLDGNVVIELARKGLDERTLTT
jgi:hypothetical protein